MRVMSRSKSESGGAKGVLKGTAKGEWVLELRARSSLSVGGAPKAGGRKLMCAQTQ
jgi:hypothetical protein